MAEILKIMSKKYNEKQAETQAMASEPVATYDTHRCFSSTPVTVSTPNNHPKDVMRSIVADRIYMMEEGTASFVDGELGFAEIRKQYGL